MRVRAVMVIQKAQRAEMVVREISAPCNGINKCGLDNSQQMLKVMVEQAVLVFSRVPRGRWYGRQTLRPLRSKGMAS
jgi:hypothetical protein